MREGRFDLVGGSCDGQSVIMPTQWDGRGYRPPPIAMALPKMSLPKFLPLDYVPAQEETTAVTYYCWIWNNGLERWYDYRPEKPES
jgi:hypothetical protein